jgi:hypothetical protein
MKENEPYSIDSFWPEASTMLDKHFARKKLLRRLRILGFGGFALLLSILALVFGSTDLFIPSAQKMEKNVSKSDSRKGVRIERLAGANSISSKLISSEGASIPSQDRFEHASQNQSANSEKVKNKTSNVQITAYRDTSTYQGNNAAFSSVQETHDENSPSGSDKFSSVNSDVAERANIPDLENEHSDKNLIANENTTNSSVVEIVQAEALAQNETENLLVIDSSNSKNNSFSEHASNTPQGGIDPELLEKKTTSWKWALVPSVGMFNSVKHLKSNTNESAYVTRRRQEEENTLRETFRMGLELSKERLTLQSGIYYSVFGERTAYTNWLMRTMPEVAFYNQVVYDTTLTLVSYLDMGNFYEISVASIDSSVQTFADTTLVTAQSAVDALPFHVQNRISYIEIPLGLRYTAYRNALVDVGISAGGSLGVLWRSRGYLVNSELNEFVQLDAAAGLQKIIGNVRIATDVRFKLSEHLQIGVRPEWNTTVGSVLRQNSIRQNYQNWGMLLEVKKTF